MIAALKSEIESIAKTIQINSNQKTTLQPLNCPTINISSTPSRNLLTTSQPQVTECCPHRCCSGSYSPARNCPGLGHSRKPDDPGVCHNHKLNHHSSAMSATSPLQDSQSPCCSHRCCRNIPARGRPGKGHSRKSTDDETICCNHRLK